MTRRILTLALLIIAAVSLLAAPGCTEKVRMPTEPPPDPPGGTLLTPDTIQAIFTSRCATCHSGSNPAAGLNLSAGSSYASTVNVASSACSPLDRIEPNDPDNSCLILRVQGTVTPRMPLGSPTGLPAADIAKLRSWVAQGAPGVVAGPALQRPFARR